MVEVSSTSSVSDGHQSGDDPCARVIAFYLPQYHPIPENDQWWGNGFTDWTNVRKAKPQFAGHDQPKVPTALGYYDLRNVDVHYAQAALAREHGIAGFCYYAYWFGGRRLLEAPLEVVAANPDLAMPYAICWANEPWSRRWDGNERDVLMEQRHSAQGDAAFINDIGAHLADSRYLRVDGRPMVLIYRARLMVDPLRTTDRLRERAATLGLGDLFLAMVQSFDHRDPRGLGLDAAVEFPPHGLWPRRSIPRAELASVEGFQGSLLRYEDVIAEAMSRPVPTYRWFRGVMPSWDNTPRRGGQAKVFVEGSPVLFRRWLEEALTYTYLFAPVAPARLLFVNAWNEWAEGAYLEPDESCGIANLRAVDQALRATHALAGETERPGEGEPSAAGRLSEARAAWRARHPSKPETTMDRFHLGRIPPLRWAARRLARGVRRIQSRIR